VAFVAVALATGVVLAGSAAQQADTTAPQGYAGGGRGFLRNPGGQFVPVDVSGATGTFPLDINNHGQMVGVYDDADGVSHGFLLTEGRFVTIDHPDAAGAFAGVAGTVAFGINDRGQIVGTYIASEPHGFLIDRGRFFPIEGPDAVTTIPVEINNRGQISVQTSHPDGSTPQYLLERGSFTPVAFPGQGHRGTQDQPARPGGRRVLRPGGRRARVRVRPRAVHQHRRRCARRGEHRVEPA
jgi:probable HAF family extracellular repeat protein